MRKLMEKRSGNTSDQIMYTVYPPRPKTRLQPAEYRENVGIVPRKTTDSDNVARLAAGGMAGGGGVESSFTGAEAVVEFGPFVEHPIVPVCFALFFVNNGMH